MKEETYIRLKVLSAYLSPEQITEAIGIPSSSSWKSGDKRGRTIIIEKENGWVVQSKLDEKRELCSQLFDFLKQIAPYSERFLELSKKNTVELSCIIYARTEPVLYFEKETIEAIAAFGASFDIDLYIG